ncbi:MAG: response regulator transcription factor [Sarcina sp.]
MINILLIDDEILIRTKIKKYLIEYDFQFDRIFESNNGLEAFKLLSNNPNISLIIADINMPIMNGIDFLKNIRSNNFQNKIIFVTGFEKFEYARESIKLGVYDYLLKPINRSELYSVLKSLGFINQSKISNKNIFTTQTDSTTKLSLTKKETLTNSSLVISNIIFFIDTNYSNKELSLNFLSKKFFINSSYLSTMFKKATNKTLIEYISEKRITKAKNLLKCNEIKISQIHEQVGYNDYYYFSKNFKKHTGLSPLKYRQQYNIEQIKIDY